MYPEGFDTFVTVGSLSERLERAVRPVHFRGVATVVTKLFNIVQPDSAYFGQKDAQQGLVIKKLVRDLNLPIEIITVPTAREPDGLALSSRNVYLNAADREAALAISRALTAAAELFDAGERDAEHVRRAMRSVLGVQSRLQLDYVSVADAETLDELDRVNRPALALAAARVGKTRLIDNVVLAPSERSNG